MVNGQLRVKPIKRPTDMRASDALVNFQFSNSKFCNTYLIFPRSLVYFFSWKISKSAIMQQKKKTQKKPAGNKAKNIENSQANTRTEVREGQENSSILHDNEDPRSELPRPIRESEVGRRESGVNKNKQG